ncbi:MAG TPA: sugar-binding protein [Anaerolineales bacterium]
MRTRVSILLSVLLLALLACTLPGTSAPTPFVFPTPNLTLTALFAPTASAAGPSTTASPTPLIVDTLEASQTAGATSSATAAPPTATVPAGSTDTRPNGSPVEAARLASPPTIDGDLSEWSSNRYSITEVAYGTGNWTGGGDLSGTYYLGWDSTYFYLGIQVNDSTFVQTASGRDLFKGDSVEILLDAALASDFSTPSLSSDDYQIGLSPGNFGSRAPEAYRWFPRSAEGPLSTTQVASSQTSDGYLLEARLPWVVFGLAPASGDRFGFALSLSDNDVAGTAVQQSMVSTVRTRSLTDPTTWGTLVLGGEG